MKYQFLGNSGLRVSELCLGAMTFGDDWGWGAAKDEAANIFKTFADAGGNFVDTANTYTNGTSETLVGGFIRDRRGEFVLATKYSATTNPKDPNAGGNHRKNMVQSVEASLKRLGTDYIDLYWVHVWDQHTPYQEMMRGLDDLVRAGKVLYVGVSDTPAWAVSQANVLAELRGWTQFVGLQIEYSLLERTPEQELLPMANAHRMAVLDWSPLAMGALTGKYLNQPNGQANGSAAKSRLDTGTLDSDFENRFKGDRVNRIAQEVVAIAGETGHSPAQVALRWILHQPSQHIPIIGARTADHLRDNMGCLDFELSPEHQHRLNEVSKIVLGFPESFLGLKQTQELILGADYEARYAHLVQPV